jgi:hypothetical protein
MDSMLKRRVASFARNFGYEDLDEASKFERYAAYTFFYRYMSDSPDSVNAVVTGGGDDLGIDIAAVVVNGVLMQEPSDIEDAIQGEGISRAKVIFAQVKSGTKQDAKMLSKFLSGVLLVTKAGVEHENIPLRGRLRDVADMIDVLAEHQDKFDSVSFPLELDYITTTTSSSSSVLNDSQVCQALKEIDNLKVYESPKVQLLGRRHIDARIQDSRGPQNVAFNFRDKVSIDTPVVGGERLEKAYIGTLPIKELLKLLLTDLGDQSEIREKIFDDNVRQFMGDANSVNRRIYQTLNGAERALFPVLNNGVTIIASDLMESSYRMQISGYQVVNGAQTCSQIVKWYRSGARSEQMENTSVPVKIIVSKDLKLRSQITVATNLQTPIQAVDIQSSSQKAKDVEEYFAGTGAQGLRYQRQIAEKGIDFTKTRIFTTDLINRAVAAAIFGDAHQIVRSPRALAEEGSPIWLDFPVELYYLSAWILYQVDSHFNRNADDSPLKAAKYHIVSLVASTLIPSLREVHNAVNVDDKVKAVHRVQSDIVRKMQESGVESAGGYLSDLTDQIRNLIGSACDVVRNHFVEVVGIDGVGRSLRKDDVRYLALSTELREEFDSVLDCAPM